jgi:starvation-inducible DNA-binding protein
VIATRSEGAPNAWPPPPRTQRRPQVGGNAPDIDIGISAEDRKKISESLMVSLADAFTLYLKTHNFHFNITGEMFNSLHAMFETQYNEQWMAFDEIAERIRAWATTCRPPTTISSA